MNLSRHYHLSFTLAVIFVFGMSTICYFILTLLVRIINIKLPSIFQLRFRPLSLNVIYNDFLEALTVGIAGIYIHIQLIKTKNSSYNTLFHHLFL